MEVVGDAVLQFEYGCYQDLADKIVMLLEDEELNRKMGVKAHTRIVNNFTWDKAAMKYLSTYKKVLRT